MTTPTPRSCIVHGPTGCGKSTNAQAIAKALGLSHIRDNWEAGAPVPLLDTLVLTSADNPAWYFNGRVLSFDQAMLLVEHAKAHDCTAPTAEHPAAAWLGQAGLYRTRFDAVRNFEQSVTPVSADELFNLASKQVLSQQEGHA
ncbi:hypothetical protein [Pseudomonas plecoglossicida]|uniref:hypothetical protein n=1 Tax=Pseudomonas plecoglossicida TaxID=70775 RepID=UPI00200A15CE|nr:hypothetical protein [Pseudomonas plecoglossicida]GLR38360.1 hypothetical protein GCM10011247_37580 [Pseudomonas plecoglossicida]